jgi:hypothetical protein
MTARRVLVPLHRTLTARIAEKSVSHFQQTATSARTIEIGQADG